MTAQVDALRDERIGGTPLRRAHSSGRPRRARGAGPIVPNAVIGTLVFLGAEAMFFGGLMSSLLVLRAGNTAWPPVDQPRLPIAVTAVNTLILLFSAYTMRRAADGVRGDRGQEPRQWLTATAVLGGVFLTVQGAEWIRLVRYGLSATLSTYGGTFYTLIGCHAVHVLGGVVVLLAVLRGALRGRYSARACGAIEACRLYWYFVVGVWPLLYVLVYLV
jgi:heme/copper-type cytochrome/quinol oxidase subunit 3